MYKYQFWIENIEIKMNHAVENFFFIEGNK